MRYSAWGTSEVITGIGLAIAKGGRGTLTTINQLEVNDREQGPALSIPVPVLKPNPERRHTSELDSAVVSLGSYL